MNRNQSSFTQQDLQNLESPTSRKPLLGPDRLHHSLLSQACAQLFSLLVSVGIGGWSARYLGPQNLGTLSYAAALVGLLSPLGSMGVMGSLRAMLCEERPKPGLLGSALLIELIVSLVIAIVIIPFVWAANDPVLTGLIGLSVLGNLMNSSEVFEVELLNRQRGTQLARVGTIQTFAGAGFSILALLYQAPLILFGVLPVLKAFIRAWLLAVSVQATKIYHLLQQASLETSRILIKRGWPLLVAGLSVMLYTKSDQVMLEWLCGSAEVGQYSVAVRVAESIYFLPMVLSSTFTPRLVNCSGNIGKDHKVRQFYRFAWLLGIGMALVLMLVLRPILPLVFGNKFLSAQVALTWLCPAALAVSMGCASGAHLNIMGHQNFIAKRTLIGAFSNVALNAILIPSMGANGAAIATTASQFIVVYGCSLMNRCMRANLRFIVFPF